MSARIFCRLILLPLLIAEALAFFVADNKSLGLALAVVFLGLAGLFYARGPQVDEDRAPCPPNCRKCAESQSVDTGEEL
ncbi:hypothetical protein [Streptomyces sp. NBC_00063]|uniref:hypothetical protein n=1 Tax=Streptomyces sp. NBC_00063 TaxID=2975638 RepID=UPI003D7253D1